MTGREEVQRARRQKFKRAMWWILALLGGGAAIREGVERFL